MVKIILLLLSIAFLAEAQVPPNTYSYYVYTSSATAATGVWTIQQPTTVTKTAVFVNMFVICVTACVADLERDGTAASATTDTIVALNPNSASPTMVAYNTSNVGTGTVLGNYNFGAGTGAEIDLTGITFYGPRAQTGRNLTFRVTSGTAIIIIKYYEQ
jgi:hypothetical protein